jgi:prephenate dehydrogenase
MPLPDDSAKMLFMSENRVSQSGQPHYRRIAIVGVGLIGGSIGLALRQRGLADEVVGIGRRQSSLQQALARGTVDRTTLDLVAGVAGAEIVIVTTPVRLIASQVRQIADCSPIEMVITDAGSVKAEICKQLESIKSFIGSHPLAGGHRSGPQHARADLFDGKTVVITPVESGKRKAESEEQGTAGQQAIGNTAVGIAGQITRFWQSLGAKVVSLAAEEHDRALAMTSHLPHWIASALAGVTPEAWLPLTATGWADSTRIAAADPHLWADIFTQNRASLLESIGQIDQHLARMRKALESITEGSAGPNALQTYLIEAKRIRDALGD